MTQYQRKTEILLFLESTREKTLWLLSLVPDAFFKVRVHDFYSPIGWHFGHIGMTEQLWVMEKALALPCHDAGLQFLFANTVDNPKDNRVRLPSREEVLAYLAKTRAEVLEALENADLCDPAPLMQDGYAWVFACQHECQHQETIVEMLQLIQKEQCFDRERPDTRVVTAASRNETRMIALPGGRFVMGSNSVHGYDNEKSAHEVDVTPFSLDLTPVTSAQWLHFLEDGGYSRKELWTGPGWAWRQAMGVLQPEYWRKVNGQSTYDYIGPLGLRTIQPDEPVSSISWYEADAYARWAEKRLPTEAEWEYASAFDPQDMRTRLFPWGDEPPGAGQATFGLGSLGPEPVEKCPQGRSALGLFGMAGNVWEWTSSPFLPYPGFQAFPYDGYSKDHMDGTHFVCRGGSWASSATILRCSFRNWYIPTYRQGFLGMRCAL